MATCGPSNKVNFYVGAQSKNAHSAYAHTYKRPKNQERGLLLVGCVCVCARVAADGDGESRVQLKLGALGACSAQNVTEIIFWASAFRYHFSIYKNKTKKWRT